MPFSKAKSSASPLKCSTAVKSVVRVQQRQSGTPSPPPCTQRSPHPYSNHPCPSPSIHSKFLPCNRICENAVLMGMQVKKTSVVALAKATTASCGAKAAACAELAQLAQKSKKKGGFGTAEGVCLPFGCMEAAVQVSLGCFALPFVAFCRWTLYMYIKHRHLLLLTVFQVPVQNNKFPLAVGFSWACLCRSCSANEDISDVSLAHFLCNG